ncbi:hypothetical protein VoSk93_23410 [Vibrio owensii]
MKKQYKILSKKSLSDFPFQQSLKPIVSDLILEMTFSPKLFIISDIVSEIPQNAWQCSNQMYRQ